MLTCSPRTFSSRRAGSERSSVPFNRIDPRTVNSWIVSAAGGEARPLTELGSEVGYPTIARGAKRLAYVRTLRDTNIWRVPGPSAEVESAPERVVYSSAFDQSARVSPDGASVVFTSFRSGFGDLDLRH